MPRKTSLNWFIPALVNSSEGSFVGTSDELRTTRWLRPSKNFRNVWRTSLPVKRSSGNSWAEQASGRRPRNGGKPAGRPLQIFYRLAANTVTGHDLYSLVCRFEAAPVRAA